MTVGMHFRAKQFDDPDFTRMADIIVEEAELHAVTAEADYHQSVIDQYDALLSRCKDAVTRDKYLSRARIALTRMTLPTYMSDLSELIRRYER